MKVSKRLGIEVLTIFNSSISCLWITIKPSSRYEINVGDNCISGNYSEESSRCSNIDGLEYWENLKEISINTYFGYRNYFWNEMLFPKLFKLETENNSLALSKNYEGCTVERKVRLNYRQRNIYGGIKKYPAENLKNCLEEIIISGIFNRDVSRDECIKNLESLGTDTTDSIIQNLKRYRIEKYSWLEYFCIATPPINIENLLNEDPETVANFEKHLELHFKGLVLADYISQKIFH